MKPAWTKRIVGPYFREGALARADKRSREAVFLRKKRQELITHCSGKPSQVQLMLIERACYLSLKIAMLDLRLVMGEMTDHDVAYYLAWTNTLRKTLVAIGIEAAAVQPPSLAEALAAGRQP